MKPIQRVWFVVLGVIACLAIVIGHLPEPPVLAQNSSDDGLFTVVTYIDTDGTNVYGNSELFSDFSDSIDYYCDCGPTVWGLTGSGGYSDSGEGAGFTSGPVQPGYTYTVNIYYSVEYWYQDDGDGFDCSFFDENGDGECSAYDTPVGYASIDIPAPPPQIASLSTYSVNQGDTGTLTISGTNLVESSTDTLNISLGGSSAPFTPTGTPTATTATFSYDFTSYPVGTYTLSVTNNEGTSNGVSFSVASQWSANPCDVSSSPKTAYSSFASSGAAGGSGTMTVSFSGAAYSTVSQTISYGSYSTPSSIAANVAALITANYTKYGLTARAFGPNIVYSGNATVGTVSHVVINNGGTSPPFTPITSTAAEAAAGLACMIAPPTPPAACGVVNPAYVLAVTNDSVTWIDVGLNRGRNVNYSLEYWPTSNGLGAPTPFLSTVTEHLSASMAYGVSTSGIPNSGQFDDILGNTGANNPGAYITDRCFTVTSPTMGNIGHVLTYDAAGKHQSDHIKITLPNGPSILNNWTKPDGSPKDISIP